MSIDERRIRSLLVAVTAFIIVCRLFYGCVQVSAIDSSSIIEFDITEKVELTGDGTSCDLMVSPSTIEITNTCNRIIGVDSVTAYAVNGWQLVESECDFNRMAADSKKIGIIANGTFDLKEKYCPQIEVSSGDRTEILISAKTGVVTGAVENEVAANIVVTLEDKGKDPNTVVTYKYPSVDFAKTRETYDHSYYGIGITRGIEGADSIKLVFSKEMTIYAFGDDHSIIIFDKYDNMPYDSDMVCTELIVKGDTATVIADLLNPGGIVTESDILKLDIFDFVVTFIPLDENGDEIILTEGAAVYDEDMNIVPLEEGDRGA